MVKLEEYYRHKVSNEAYDLFAVFARFEYAMKKGGFRQQRSADASWWTFGDSFPADFFDRMKAADAAKIYFEAPPDHLVPDGAGVDWSKSPKVPQSAREVFESIKIARNNLFHGDKRHDNDRDQRLMIAALFILNSAYEAAKSQPAFSHFISHMEYGL